MVCSCSLYGQEFSAEEQAELDALEAELMELDTTNLLQMLDSLILLEQELKKTLFQFKSGFSNEQLNQTREAVSDQSGYYVGANITHRTGIYFDLLYQFNDTFKPAYYLTTASLGYLNGIGKHFSYLISYEHYFFNNNLENETLSFPFTDALNGSFYYVSKYFDVGTDYSVNLGSEETSHRLMGSIILNGRLKKVLFFDEVRFRPGFTLLYGNQTVQYLFIDRQFLRPRLRFQFREENQSGLMNWGISLPVYLKLKNFTFSASYQYNKPQALPNETLSFDESHVFGMSLWYSFRL